MQWFRVAGNAVVQIAAKTLVGLAETSATKSGCRCKSLNLLEMQWFKSLRKLQLQQLKIQRKRQQLKTLQKPKSSRIGVLGNGFMLLPPSTHQASLLGRTFRLTYFRNKKIEEERGVFQGRTSRLWRIRGWTNLEKMQDPSLAQKSG
jgi:hypothetical protein